MATRKYDKLVLHDALWGATNAKQKLAQCIKIDADSVPAAFCKSFKISVTDNTSESSNLSYAFYACLNEGLSFSSDRIIDHLVISPGGGTGYLNINRKIWSNADQEAGVGGPVTIWAECSDTIDTSTYTITCLSQRAKFQTV